MTKRSDEWSPVDIIYLDFQKNIIYTTHIFCFRNVKHIGDKQQLKYDNFDFQEKGVHQLLRINVFFIFYDKYVLLFSHWAFPVIQIRLAMS